MGKIRVVIADDHPAFREGLCRLLCDENEMEVVGQAADGEAAISLSENLNPDVVIMDISMPRLSGIEATKRIRDCSPDTAVIVVSAYNYQNYILASLQAGAAGYLTKDTPIRELIAAVQLANTGGRIIYRSVVESLIQRLTSSKYDGKGSLGLHSREIEVLKLIARGMRNKEIARKMNISDRTVQSHMVNIFNKLDVGSRTEAVLQALKNGWIDICDLSN